MDEAYKVEAVSEWVSSHKQVWNDALALEGFVRQTGVHAAGIIISPELLNETVGVTIANGEPTVQFSMGYAEKYGLLKMDFLGLSTLGLIKNTQKLGIMMMIVEKVISLSRRVNIPY